MMVLCMGLCSCGRNPEAKEGGGGNASKLSSMDETRQIGMHVLLNRYPQAQIVSESAEGQKWKYRFSTNGVVLPLAVVVDRKSGQARFEKVNR